MSATPKVKYCHSCGAYHQSPVGKGCKEGSPGVHKEKPATRSVTAMQHLILEDVPEEDMDDEEKDLVKQIKQVKAAQRKKYLKWEIERLKRLNEEEEASPPPAPGGGPGAPAPPASGLPGRWRELEQSPETERRKRSKFDLAPLLEGRNIEKIAFSDFIYASMRWGVDMEDVTVEDLKGYMAHVGYLAMREMSGLYIPRAVIGYDKDVRIMADKRGMCVFTGGIESVSNCHFNYDNTEQAQRAKESAAASAKPKAQTAKPKQQGRTDRPRRGPCYEWNLEKDGCADRNCDRYHSCMYCWDPSHTAQLCKDRGSGRYKSAHNGGGDARRGR